MALPIVYWLAPLSLRGGDGGRELNARDDTGLRPMS